MVKLWYYPNTGPEDMNKAAENVSTAVPELEQISALQNSGVTTTQYCLTQ
jgi:hypothetical protein